MSSINCNGHHNHRTPNRRVSSSLLSLAGYRARLLRRCLDHHDQYSLVRSASSESATGTVSSQPTAANAQSEITELLDFLQQDAAPYETRTPPYLQIPGDPRHRQERAGVPRVRASKPSTPRAAKNIQERRTNENQTLRYSTQGTFAAQEQLSGGLPGEGAAAVAAPADHEAAGPRQLHYPRALLFSREEVDTRVNPASLESSTTTASPHPEPAAVQEETPQSSSQPEAQKSSGTTGQFGTGFRKRSGSEVVTQKRPPSGTPVHVAGGGATRGDPGGKTWSEQQRPGLSNPTSPGTERAAATLHAADTAATRGSLVAAAGNSVSTVEQHADLTDRPGCPGSAEIRTGGRGRGGDTGPAAAGAAVPTYGTGRQPSGGSKSRRIGSSSTDSGAVELDPVPYGGLDTRRAAVMWQWQNLLGSRPGQRQTGQQATSARSVGSASGLGAVPSAEVASSAPPQPGGASLGHDSTAPISMATAATSTQAQTQLQTQQQPQRQHQQQTQQPAAIEVPGLRSPPPLRPLPNAALGAVDPGPATATATAAAPPPYARVPTALLPLTIQGRISLIEAALSTAAATAAAAIASSPQPGKGGAVAASSGNDIKGIRTPGLVAKQHVQEGQGDGPGQRTLTRDKGSRADSAGAGPISTGPVFTAPAKASAADTTLAPGAVGAAAAATRGAPAAATAAATWGGPAGEAAVALAGAEAAAARYGASARAAETTQGASRVTGLGGSAAPLGATGEAPDGIRSVLPPAAAAARELLLRLVEYLPRGREDGPALLAPYVRYQYGPYQEAAVVAAAYPDLVLRTMGLQQLSYIAAAYAAAGHRHEPFLRELAAAAVEKLTARRRARGVAAAAAVQSPAAPLTFRTACALLTALARLQYRHVGLTAALGHWLAAALRSGQVVPRAKWKGTWLAAALWAFATLEQLGAACDDSNGAVASAAAGKGPDVATAGAMLFSEAAEAIRVDPGWIHLMDGREALWALWGLKVAAALYGQTAEAAAAAGATGSVRAAVAAGAAVSYTPQPLVELQLLERAVSQLDQLDPGQLAEAYAVAAEAGLGADRDMLAALRRCTLARVAAARPQPLAVMVAALAVMGVQDLVWLTALAAACRNKMINMKPEQIVVVLHSLAVSLHFYYMPLFHAAAVLCTLPGFARLDGMPAGDVVRLAAAYAAVGHYEAILLRRMADRIVTHGSAATAWQRASVLVSCARLAYRSNSLLRCMATEAFALAAPAAPAAAGGQPQHGGLPAAQLAAVAAACGQLQFRPPGLLAALHAARAAEWPRLSLGQRAAMCWSLLVLTGGLAGSTACTGGPGANAAEGTAVNTSDLTPSPASESAAAPAGAVTGTSDGPVVHRRGRGRRGGTQKDAPQQQRQQGQEQQQVAALAAERGRRQQQVDHQQQQLVEALCEYLQALASTDPRVWPASDHHAQLLAACCTWAWQQPQPPHPHAPQEEKPQRQQQQHGGGRDSSHRSSSIAAATAAGQDPAASPATAEGQSAGSASAMIAASRVGSASVWAALSRRLRASVQRLPAAATRRALAAQQRQRQAALGPWAAEVTDVVRQAMEATAAVDAGDGDAGGATRPWRDSWGLSRRVCRVKVTEGLLLCGGAMSVDVAVEVELDEVAPDSTVHPGSQNGTASTAAATAAALVAAGPGPHAGSGSGAADRSAVPSPVQSSNAARERVCIALELCALQPPGAGLGSAAGRVSSSGVVRNSRWLLSGSAALRRRLLTGLGWLVVPVRERVWQGLRSPEQRRRAVEAWLRRAVSRVAYQAEKVVEEEEEKEARPTARKASHAREDEGVVAVPPGAGAGAGRSREGAGSRVVLHRAGV